MQAFLEENVPQNTQNGVIFKTWNWNLAIFFIQICRQHFFFQLLTCTTGIFRIMASSVLACMAGTKR